MSYNVSEYLKFTWNEVESKFVWSVAEPDIQCCLMCGRFNTFPIDFTLVFCTTCVSFWPYLTFNQSNMKVEATYNDQWHLTADENGYHIENPADDGTRRFYEVNSGPYGNPVITAEPDLAFPAPSTVDYVDSQGNSAQPEEQIAGIICKKAVKVLHRFSLSNPKRPEFTAEQEGAELVIDDVRWYLRALFRKDKNRIINYDAWYGEDRPDSVQIVELEDLDF